MTTTDDSMDVVRTFEDATTEQSRPRSVNIRQVMTLKRRLFSDEDLFEIVDDEITFDDLENYVDVLLPKMPKGVHRKALFWSLTHLCQEPVSEQTLGLAFWRLAGNVWLLKAGRAVPPWTRQSEAEWMPLQVVDSVTRRAFNDKVGEELSFRVLAGTATSHLVAKFWPRRFSKYLSEKMGYSKPWGKHSYKEARAYVGMRLYGLFTPELCLGGPCFDKVSVTSGCVTFNKALIKRRKRVGFQCPMGYVHDCTRCHIGYSDCPVAVHPRSYVKFQCDMCNSQAWFDPNKVDIGLCVNCAVTKALEKEE